MFDGDLAATFSHPTIINNKIDGNPIDYKHGVAKKVVLSDKDLEKGDTDGFGSKIGFITNTSSTYHVLKYRYPIGSPERKEIEKRLKFLRMYQGYEIDSAKVGGTKKQIPESWVKYRKDLSDIDKKLIADQRPYFTRYLYDSYEREYLDEVRNNDKYCYSRFGMSFAEIEKNPDTPLKKRTVNNFYKYSFFLYPHSPMNRITWHMEEALGNIRTKISGSEFDYASLYSSSSPEIDPEKRKRLTEFMEKYIVMKRVWHKSPVDFKKDIWDALSQIKNDVLTEVSSDGKEVGDLCVSLLISTKRADSFVWGLFGDYIIENILNRHGRQITVPVRDDFGDIDFLYNKYSTRRIYV